MTCFWDGIMKSLTKSDRELLGLRTANIYTLIERLQHLNCKPLILTVKIYAYQINN